MDAAGHALFETAIGFCGMAWGPRGITAVQLPEATAAATVARMLRHTGPSPEVARPPQPVRDAMAGVQALLAGQRPDLREVVLDMAGLSDFHQRVYEITRAIAPGSTRSYGEIALELGNPRLARAVGQALGLNPFAPVVPCHRVLAAGRRAGGFSAEGGAMTKLRMLEIEGAWPGGGASLFASGP